MKTVVNKVDVGVFFQVQNEQDINTEQDNSKD